MLAEELKVIEFKKTDIAQPDLDERFDALLRKARLINSHLLLKNNAQVAHVTYDDGKLTHALAYSNPDYFYIGVLYGERDVQTAKEKYELPNLKYTKSGFEDAEKDIAYDAMIVADVIHKIYNYSNYSKTRVKEFISTCLDRLKTGGQLLIRDYSVSNPNEPVCLELPYYKNSTNYIENLMRFKEANSSIRIEEIKTEKTYTRSFEMPYKAAYDFVVGKDKKEFKHHESWEVVTFSTQEYLELIEQNGGRVLYMSPNRDEPYIRENFHERFKLYSEGSVDLGFPATSYFVLIQKLDQNESLYLYEKGKLKKKPQNLSVSSVVDDVSGNLFEVVKSHTLYADIIPYRITKAGKLNIFLTESTPHGIVNTIISKSENLDNRHWSGHLVDSVKLECEEVQIYKEQGEHEVRQLIYDQHKIVTACGSALEAGPALYPAPDYIDELRECYYIEVCKNYNFSECLSVIKNSHVHSKSRPQLRELDAQKVLNAIRVGLIPSSLLETQVVYLMEKLSISPDRETEKNIPLDTAEPKRKLGKRELMSFLSNREKRFKETRERTDKLDIVRSQFVDEGKVGDEIIDIASDEEEFITFSKQTTNTALVVPLTKDLGGEILAGFEARFLPVPERFTGSSASIAAPAFPLPKEITNYDLAKEYIAKQFKVTPDRVGKLGESYFTQMDMTPHRIYPFVVATAAYDREGWGGKSGEDGFTAYSPLEEIWKLIYWDNTKSFMTISARLMTRWCQDSNLSMSKKFGKSLVSEKISDLNKTNFINTSNKLSY